MTVRKWMLWIGVVLLAGCGKQQAPVISDSVPVATFTPEPIAARVEPRKAASQPRLAPEGVYYLVRKVSITTDSGVSTAHPGTRVTFVREENGKMIVHDGRMELAVQKDYLTNDLDEAQAFSAPSAVVSGSRSKPIAPTAAAQSDPAQQTVSEPTHFATPESVVIPASRKVNMAKIQAMQSQIDALGVKIAADERELTVIEEEAASRQWQRQYWGKASQNSVGVKESKYVVQQRLAALQRQQNALMMQLNSLNQ